MHFNERRKLMWYTHLPSNQSSKAHRCETEKNVNIIKVINEIIFILQSIHSDVYVSDNYSIIRQANVVFHS